MKTCVVTQMAEGDPLFPTKRCPFSIGAEAFESSSDILLELFPFAGLFVMFMLNTTLLLILLLSPFLSDMFFTTVRIIMQ